ARPRLDALALGGGDRRHHDRGWRGEADPDRGADEQLVRPLPGGRAAEGEAARLGPGAVRRGDRAHRHRGGEAAGADLQARDLARYTWPAPLRGRLMVGRPALDREVGVRIPAPQPRTLRPGGTN